MGHDAACQGDHPHRHCSAMLQAHEVGQQATEKAYQAADYTREKVGEVGEYGCAKAGKVLEEVNATSHINLCAHCRVTHESYVQQITTKRKAPAETLGHL